MISFTFPLFLTPIGLGYVAMSQVTGSWLDFVAGLAIMLIPWVAVYFDRR